MFLLVPAYPGCPGSKAVKRSLLLLLFTIRNQLQLISLPPLQFGSGYVFAVQLLVRLFVARITEILWADSCENRGLCRL